MNRLVLTAMLACACLMAQPPAGRRGGPMGFGPGPMGPGGPEMRSTVTGAPYSGVEVTTEVQALAGGNVIQRSNTRNIYRDGQGRVRTESQMTRPGAAGASATTVQRVTISDPVAGYVHEIDPQRKTVMSRQVHMGNRQNAPARTGTQNTAMATGNGRPGRELANNANVKTEDLGTQNLNGVIATGTRVTHTIAAGTIGNAQAIQSVHETWVSADLKVPVLIKVTDPRFGTRTTQLQNVNRGEPDASLFVVPSGYTAQRGGGPGRGPRPAGNGGGQKN